MSKPVFNPKTDGNVFHWILKTAQEQRTKPVEHEHARFQASIAAAQLRREAHHRNELRKHHDDPRGKRETGYKSTAD